MELSINTLDLGKGRLWNNCNERYCALGLVCKEAGIADDDMGQRDSIVFKKRPDEKDANGQVKEFPLKNLPNELSLFFTEDTGWSPISLTYKDSKKFRANTLGQKIIDLNDNRPDGWKEQLVETLVLGGVDLALEENKTAE